MPVASRIVNDVAYVTTMNDAYHFSWQVAGAAFGEVGG